MPQGNTWQELLKDSGCKYQLIEMIIYYVLEFGSGILQRSIPFIITQEKINIFFHLLEIKY